MFRKLSVLVVEDESIIRMLMVDALEDAGFHVIEAATGEAGLRALDHFPDLKALLTDIEMPGTVDGLALARMVHERHPETALIIMSGRQRPEAKELPRNAKFFRKPYTQAEIVAALHQLIRKSPEAD
jgi:CheY-like chemotaxis protein